MRTRRPVAFVAVLAALVLSWLLLAGPGGEGSSLRILTARKIITMEPERPVATSSTCAV